MSEDKHQRRQALMPRDLPWVTGPRNLINPEAASHRFSFSRLRLEILGSHRRDPSDSDEQHAAYAKQLRAERLLRNLQLAVVSGYRWLWGINPYVFARCEHGDVNRLPGAMCAAANSLGMFQQLLSDRIDIK